MVYKYNQRRCAKYGDLKVYDARNMDDSPIRIWKHCTRHIYNGRPPDPPHGRLPDNDRA